MSIFTALMNSVTGLRAQSYALENISDNIANSQTAGYKRVDTSFMDMVADAPLRRQTGGAVSYFSRATNTIGGAITNSNVSTNFALNGNGFVAVRQRLDAGTDLPTFSQTNLYTRRGDFAVDRQGFLVNGAGNYLLGTPVDPATGQATGTGLDVVQVAVNAIPPRASTTFTYRATVPSTPATPNYDPAVAGSDVWTTVAAAPAQVTPASAPSSQSFASNSISGGTGRFYNALGTPVDVDLRWAKLGPTTAAGDTTWGLYFNSAPGTNAAASSWTRASNVTFNNAGVATAPAAPIQVDMSARGLGTLSVDVAGGVGQYHLDSKQVDLAEFSQDGYSAGELDQVYVSSAGMVTGSFTNGRTQALAQIAIAQFNAPDMLERQSGSAFAETIESGMPLMNAVGTSLISGSLEGSNTDIAEEFSRMIVTQQAYSANTRVMSTAQDMLRDVMNVLR